MFEKNLGQIDRIVRIIVGLAFVVLVYYFAFMIDNPGLLEYSLAGLSGILAIVLVVTGAFGTCPLYSVLNFNTNKGHPSH